MVLNVQTWDVLERTAANQDHTAPDIRQQLVGRGWISHKLAKVKKDKVREEVLFNIPELYWAVGLASTNVWREIIHKARQTITQNWTWSGLDVLSSLSLVIALNKIIQILKSIKDDKAHLQISLLY